MSLLLLLIAWVMTGLCLVLNKVLVGAGLSNYVSIYMMSGSLLAVVVGIGTKVKQPYKPKRADAVVGVGMGVTAAINMFAMLVALKLLPGSVVFPVRGCGNALLTAVLSYLLLRERLNPLQVLGVLCAAASIYLIVS